MVIRTLTICKPLLLVACMACISPVFAEARLALVIGNGGYKDSPLNNPHNDATDMAQVLEGLGFEVILETDADRRSMARAIRKFGTKLKKDRGVGLFYYAGHGMQVDNRNYLIPVDAPLAEEDEVPYESIDVGSVLAKMQSAGNSLNLLFLDACRNNPFPNKFRSSNRGLARVEAPVGSLVVYATAPGKIAADGTGRNGTFTGQLIKHLRKPGLSLTQTIRQTRAAVVAETNGRQVPWESSSLLKEYFLSKKVEPPPAEPAADESNTINKERLELVFWESARTGNSITEYQAYLDKFPNGMFAELAKSRIAVAKESIKSNDQPIASNNEALNETKVAVLDESTNNKSPNDVSFGSAKSLKPSTDVRRMEPAAVTTNTRPSIKSSKTQITDAPETTPVKTPPQSQSSSLTVKVTPPEALVRIMNIPEKYKPAITLKRGKEYDVYVTHNGYVSWRENIELSEENVVLEIELEEKAIVVPTVIPIAGGTFKMGCSANDSSCSKYEKPAHKVTVSSFHMTKTEISVGQFQSFVNQTGYQTEAEKNTGGFRGCYIWSEKGGISRSNATWDWKAGASWRKPGYAQTANHPVTCVSWNDAARYAEWLSAHTNEQYSLPSEAEWEFAARANQTTKYSFGNNADKLCSYANGADKSTAPKGSKWSNRINCLDKHWFSAPVGSFRANAFGLYDMHGNVWEWVSDSWLSNYSNAPTNGAAHQSNKDDQRVLRGGAWAGNASVLRVSNRSKSGAARRAAMIGFRLVKR